MTATLHERLKEATGRRTLRHISTMTGVPQETVRRYMNGHPPSAEFLVELCRRLGVSGEWLLTGRGPMGAGDLRAHALGQADPSELLQAMAVTIECLLDRVNRLERYVQVLESELRTRKGGDVEQEGGAVGAGRARRIGDALAGRSPRDAD